MCLPDSRFCAILHIGDKAREIGQARVGTRNQLILIAAHQKQRIGHMGPADISVFAQLDLPFSSLYKQAAVSHVGRPLGVNQSTRI